VGLRSYLETGAVTSHTMNGTTPFGPLELTAESTYTVDWGDGTVTGPHTDPGGPYPDGRITHTYQRSGTYDIVVTQTWTATWTIGEFGGTLPARSATFTLPEYPARQVQAVRTR
jgi:hypothetical protein